jgi:hypothetical protein
MALSDSQVKVGVGVIAVLLMLYIYNMTGSEEMSYA